MKILKPSNRERKRYLLINGKDATEGKIEEAILNFIGILGYSKASPSFLKKKKDSLVLAINHRSLDKIKASLLISGANITITKISGTLSGLGR
jgi:RNase P/RNase MRP subunit POP5